MPFKSEAQRRKFGAMANRGEISQDTFNEWNEATGSRSLPEKKGNPGNLSKEGFKKYLEGKGENAEHETCCEKCGAKMTCPQCDMQQPTEQSEDQAE